MRPRTAALLLLAAGALILPPATAQRQPWFRLPPHPDPDLFGNLLINRNTASGSVKPAAFSHWSHRRRHTCRVCHLELDFALKRNATGITEEGNRKGRYCGACHNGKTAFGHIETNCSRCHTGDAGSGREGFSKLAELPFSKFGNGVDWSAAIASKKIAPAASLTPGFRVMKLETSLSLDAGWAMVPPANFPHAEHTVWLDCANCHPDPFNIQKKTTQHFTMKANLSGLFCGACHLNVAFPLDDCKRCHPKMRDS